MNINENGHTYVPAIRINWKQEDKLFQVMSCRSCYTRCGSGRDSLPRSWHKNQASAEPISCELKMVGQTQPCAASANWLMRWTLMSTSCFSTIKETQSCKDSVKNRIQDLRPTRSEHHISDSSALFAKSSWCQIASMLRRRFFALIFGITANGNLYQG